MSTEQEAKRVKTESPAVDEDLPDEDCTRFNFFIQTTLNDRKLLSWALKTETKVRFSKVQSRDTLSNISTTLDSKYLIELYPKVDGEIEESDMDPMLERDLHAFERKSLQALLQRNSRPDASIESLIQITFPGHIMAENALPRALEKNLAVVPPNLLYFEIILEAFMGYKIARYHSQDSTMPRAAIMGGAVVAVLTSWRDKRIVEMFAKNEQSLILLLQSDDPDQYNASKEGLLKQLHSYFMHDASNSCSVFSTGDVDIFLQASPLTRSLVHKLSAQFPTEVVDHISNFLGGCGFVQEDLQRFATNLCSRLVPISTVETDPGFSRLPNTHTRTRTYTFCYALAKNGLSFTQTRGQNVRRQRRGFENEKRETNGDSETRIDTYVTDGRMVEADAAVNRYGYSQEGVDQYKAGDPWYRTSQIIMLSERADLVGGLMDFDLSVATCAYDGLGVKIAPRAAFSLATMTQVVTPFCLEEKRNQKRIVKYFKRGLPAYMLDPCCAHGSQCQNGVTTILQRHWLEKPGLQTRISNFRVHDTSWKSEELRTEEEYNRINDLQRADDVTNGFFVCHTFVPYPESAYHYSVALFEKEEGHAINYFARRFRWSEDHRRQVEAIPAHLRFACRKCRREYAVQLVLEKVPFSHPETTDEVLHGDLSYKNSKGFSGDLEPSFYSGPAFNSILVGSASRTTNEMLSVLHAQLIAEKARFILREGSLKGYRQRFAFGDVLNEVFGKARKLTFPDGARPPVGLNPERFIGKCEDCDVWLFGNEFGTKWCETCSKKKPAPAASTS